MVKHTSSPWPVRDPPFLAFWFSDVRSGWVWLVVRLYVGWKWLEAGLLKWNPTWLEGGTALKVLWERALVDGNGGWFAPFGWYRDGIAFLLHIHAYTWLAKVIVAGEVLIGLSLILGVFVGGVALVGTFMSWNSIMVGITGINLVLLPLALLLVFAWKVAGYVGLDYFLLPWLFERGKEKTDPSRQQNMIEPHPPYISGRM